MERQMIGWEEGGRVNGLEEGVDRIAARTDIPVKKA
jgi:hypothetical protein